MSRVVQENGQLPEPRRIADNVVSSKQDEIVELRGIKEREFGSSKMPTMMSPEDRSMFGTMMPGDRGSGAGR
jgi:hypothetical protein